MTDIERERINAICEVAGVTEIDDLSDGFHTFRQLYYQRMILFAAIVGQNKNKAWKSFRHENGELCFGGGWFIVGIDTPEGSYTYHYENKYWDMFDCAALPRAKHWDGHTEKDVTRLLSLQVKIDTNDLISRQAAINEFAPYAEYESNRTNAEWVRRINMVLSGLPPAETENTEEFKKNLLRTINTGIVATNTKDDYSCGMRNGMRWCKALLDDKEPKYEHIEQPKWIPCSERLPEPGEYYLVTRQIFGWNCTEYREIDIAKYDSDGWYKVDDISSITVLAWCELRLPKPWEGKEGE